MAKRVVIAGGGIAGSLLAKLLEKDADVTLIDSKDYLEVRWATPRAFVDPALAERIEISHSDYLHKAKVQVGIIEKLTLAEKPVEAPKEAEVPAAEAPKEAEAAAEAPKDAEAAAEAPKAAEAAAEAPKEAEAAAEAPKEAEAAAEAPKEAEAAAEAPKEAEAPAAEAPKEAEAPAAEASKEAPTTDAAKEIESEAPKAAEATEAPAATEEASKEETPAEAPKAEVDEPKKEDDAAAKPEAAEAETKAEGETAKEEAAPAEPAAPAAAAGEVELSDGSRVAFDYLVVCTGSKVETPAARDEKVAFFKAENEKLQKATNILIVGGGPSGVEVAGEILTDLPGKKITIVHSGERLCEFLKPKASTKILTWLKAQGVEVLFGDSVDAGWDKFGASGTFTTASGKEIAADYVVVTVGNRPNTTWLEGSLGEAVEKGRVKVDAHLRVEGQSNVFAIGDITNIKELKQGYYAQMHARALAHNLVKLIKNPNAKPSSLKSYAAGMDVGMVSLGRKQGVAQLPFGTFMGWVPTNLKSKGLFVNKIRADLGLKG
eukprot:TRINITY_DN34559_c0_g1_i8.p1 TRINITY_DN34559_c0_g1~~TRINITY_DN34559_c0_g1_i8.p1  ORF type:complete len:545 (-),score=108.73 TRINITY_DN34559_c0_g1_i8:326-1960(-)